MSKKILSVVLATLVTSSCFTTKVLATDNKLSNKILINKPVVFNLEESYSGVGQGSTLDKAMSQNLGKDLVIHKDFKTSISTFSNGPSLREGELNNIVIYAKFKGEDDLLDASFKGMNIKSTFNNMYNDSNISVNKYYDELTQGKLDLKTKFLGSNSSVTQAIELDNERGYYMPYSNDNKIGYCEYVVVDENSKYIADMYLGDERDVDPSDGVVSQHYLEENQECGYTTNELETLYRELKLVNEITAKVDDSILSNSDIDKNGDGQVDSAAFIMGVTPNNPISQQVEWGHLLWPHQTSMIYGASQEEINELIYVYDLDFSFLDEVGNDVNNKKIGKYNLFTSDFLLDKTMEVQSDKGVIGQTGTLCHELAHTLNLPDLYSYRDQSLGCVGTWDVMENTGVIPQYMNSYMRKEAGWLNDNQFITVDTDGEYELKALPNVGTNDVASYVIKVPGMEDQFFFVEYRDAVGAFEGASTIVNKGTGDEYETRNIYESGLVMYRVDTSVENTREMLIPGNFEAPPYNIYNLRTEGEAAQKGFTPGVDFIFSAINGIDEHSYGSIDSSVVKNTFAFQNESGANVENSRVVLDNVRVEDGKMKFNIDAKDPSVLEATIVDNKVIVSFDEELSEVDLTKVYLSKDGANEEINTELTDEGKIAISLKTGDLEGGYTVKVLKDAIKDVVGKTMTTDFEKEVNVAVSVSDVKLDKTEVDLKVGENVKLTATVNPTNATNKNVTWVSSDDTIATVDTDGKVVAVKGGEAVITVTTEDGSKTATCKITVENVVVEPEVVAVTGVTLDKTEADLKVGENVKLTATVNPTNATNKNVTWASSDDTIATVDADGKVIAVKEGQAVITVTTQDGGKTAICNVKVEKSIAVKPEPDDEDKDESDKKPSGTEDSESTNTEDKLPQTGNESPVLPIAIAAIIIGSALVIRKRNITME